MPDDRRPPARFDREHNRLAIETRKYHETAKYHIKAGPVLPLMNYPLQKPTINCIETTLLIT